MFKHRPKQFPSAWRSTALVLALAVATPATAERIPMDPDHWQLNVFDGGVAEFVDLDGERALRIGGASAVLVDQDFRDGVIEYDLYLEDEWSFQMVFFRLDVETEFHEQFYTRPRQTRRSDALQYTPAEAGGAGWQMFHGEGFWGEADLPMNQWFRVRLEIQDDMLRAFVNREGPDAEPNLVARLRRDPINGPIGFSSAFAVQHFANIEITHGRPLDGVDVELPEYSWDPNLISDWEVAGPVQEDSLPDRLDAATLRDMDWQDAAPEDIGIVDISRTLRRSPETGNTAYLRTIIPRGEEQALRIRYGYSDRVRVYYNGRLIAGGNASWRSRDIRYLGSIGLHDDVWVDTTERARNELVFAISESFGGWGLTAATGDAPEPEEGE